MRKPIRLLVENIFYDIYDIDQENNSSVEIADDIFNYKVGNIYYLNKKPYAVCCGAPDSFKDNNPRFIYLDIKPIAKQWTTNRIITKKLPNINIYGQLEKMPIPFNSYISMDENGYENTQIIKNKCNIEKYPAFNYCNKLGDDFYFPAIDELVIFMKYKSILQDNIRYLTLLNRYNFSFLISSTTIDNKRMLYINYDSNDISIGKWQAFYFVKYFYTLPFIKLN